MNIIGKILVVLNLVFAVTVGGFLIIDVATRSNWKAAYEARADDIKALSASRATWIETASLAQNQAKTERDERLKLEKGRVGDKEDLKALLLAKDLELESKDQKIKESDLSAQRALTEAKRFQEESILLKKTIAAREGEILGYAEKYQEKTKEHMAEQERANNLQIRAQSLQEELLITRRALAEKALAFDSDAGKPVQAQDPSKPNPPAKDVKGKITKVDTENPMLVSVNVGRDEGVDKNHTLEVFRTSPTPEYIGMIRIINADYHQATGRLIRNQFTPAKTLREGDTVASRLR